MTRLFIWLQHVLPQHALSRLVYVLTHSRARWLKDALISLFTRGYHPDMSDAVQPDLKRYASFNDFFTRRLKADSRPLDPDARRVLSPADGSLSAAGDMHDNRLLQAKGRDYSLQALLAGNAHWSQLLRGGSYLSVYLAPYNYHRVHMPLTGTLAGAWHVPGRLFSVNQATAAQVEGLFARNERVVCAFESAHGPFVVVLVGALNVGSMATVWHGEITARSARCVTALTPRLDAAPTQSRGAELGCFNMGSTVIMLLPPAAVRWDQRLQEGLKVRVGEGLGTLSIKPA